MSAGRGMPTLSVLIAKQPKEPGMHSNRFPALRLSARGLLAGLFLCVSLAPVGADPGEEVSRTTVPLVLGDNNRPYVNVALRGPDGAERTLRMLLDTGGGGFILGEDTARALGLDWDKPAPGEEPRFAKVKSPPEARLGAKALSLVPERVLVALGEESGMPGDTEADGLFPGHVLAQYHVIVDYPAGELTLAKPGGVEPRGEPLPMGVSKPMGFPRTEVRIDGEEYGFLLDTGPPATMVSQALVEQWRQAHPDWERHDGAAGVTRQLEAVGGRVLETMTVRNAKWGPFKLDDFAVAAQPDGTFEDYMSGMMSGPVIGALGGNVLRGFRVELDYANETLYLSRP